MKYALCRWEVYSLTESSQYVDFLNREPDEASLNFIARLSERGSGSRLRLQPGRLSASYWRAETSTEGTLRRCGSIPEWIAGNGALTPKSDYWKLSARKPSAYAALPVLI